jgi:hypothetical protein
VKLKTVSLFTMLFSLLCLAAFLAGRPPLAASGAVHPVAAQHPDTREQNARRTAARGHVDKKQLRLATATAGYGTMMREGS